MKLGRSFFTLYFLIISIFIISSWLLDEMWSSILEQDIESYTGYKTMLAAVGDYVKEYPQDEWKQLVEAAGQRWELSLSLLSIDDVDNEKYSDHEKLEKHNTHVYYYGDEVILHHVIEGTNMIIALGPARMPTRPRAEAIVRVLVLAFLALIIFFWLWPMSKDLDQLQRATGKFGTGDFDTKATEANSSMMVPMVGAFNMMAERIKRLIEAHKELTNAVAHELRTPLARSKFALQMISMAKDDAKREKYLNQISSDVSELDELINEMLVYASFDNATPDLKFESQNINQIIEKQINSYVDYDGEIMTNFPPRDVSAFCDLHFIERALHNYISNAIKYGDGVIRITLKTQNNLCIVKVEDNGKGVSDEFKNIVFDAFSRVDNSRNKDTGGFGLGLAIVGRVMEWHKGSVNVEDSDLGGAAFSLSWPIKSANREPN